MKKKGFDNDKYLKMQSERIMQRVESFGGKLYLEFGGKLFDDFHAARVLPGFEPDSKMRMLLQLKDQAEIVFAICGDDIEKNKIRGDLGITYDLDVLRLIDAFQEMGLPCFEPFGAFYVFPCIKEFGMSSEEFATRLLEEERVAVVPGDAFGASGEGFIRISYAYSLENLKVALERLGRFVRKLRSRK